MKIPLFDVFAHSNKFQGYVIEWMRGRVQEEAEVAEAEASAEGPCGVRLFCVASRRRRTWGGDCALHARVVRVTFFRDSTLVLRPKQWRGRQSQSWNWGGLSDGIDRLRKGPGSLAWEQKLSKELPRTIKPGEQGYEIHQRGFLNTEADQTYSKSVIAHVFPWVCYYNNFYFALGVWIGSCQISFLLLFIF